MRVGSILRGPAHPAQGLPLVESQDRVGVDAARGNIAEDGFESVPQRRTLVIAIRRESRGRTLREVARARSVLDGELRGQMTGFVRTHSLCANPRILCSLYGAPG